MSRPDAILVTHNEGGEWRAFPSPHYPNGLSDGVLIHSIMFDDGTIWDAVNGWRSIPEPPQPKTSQHPGGWRNFRGSWLGRGYEALLILVGAQSLHRAWQTGYDQHTRDESARRARGGK